jgi:hypothetical protein
MVMPAAHVARIVRDPAGPANPAAVAIEEMAPIRAQRRVRHTLLGMNDDRSGCAHVVTSGDLPWCRVVIDDPFAPGSE